MVGGGADPRSHGGIGVVCRSPTRKATMSIVREIPRASVLAVLLLAVVCAGLATPSPAHADRCEPEELVLGPGNSPVDERDSPVCVVMLTYVYPFICDDFTTAMRCSATVNPDANYRPPLVPAYSPQADRVVCNAVNFTLTTAGQAGVCVR